MKSLNIKPLPIFDDNYVWLIEDKPQKIAVCVDPGDPIPVLNYLKNNGLSLEAILITHHHDDHIGGVTSLVAAYPNCHVFAPNDKRIPSVTNHICDNDLIKLSTQNLSFRVMETPGHTDSHVCFFSDNHGNAPILFSGDTLFSGGCGRLLGGTAKQLFSSLQQLAQLPNETHVYCTHEYTRGNLFFYQSLETSNTELAQYINDLSEQKQPLSLPSTLAREKAINPFLRCHTNELKERFKTELATLTPQSIFTHLRSLKDNF